MIGDFLDLWISTERDIIPVLIRGLILKLFYLFLNMYSRTLYLNSILLPCGNQR